MTAETSLPLLAAIDNGCGGTAAPDACPFVTRQRDAHQPSDPAAALARVREVCQANGLGHLRVRDAVGGSRILMPVALADHTVDEVFSRLDNVCLLWVSGLYHLVRALLRATPDDEAGPTAGHDAAQRLPRKCVHKPAPSVTTQDDADRSSCSTGVARCPFSRAAAARPTSSLDDRNLERPRLTGFADCAVLTRFVTAREAAMLHQHLFTRSKFAAQYVVDHAEIFHRALTVQFCLWTSDVNVLGTVFDPNANSAARRHRMEHAAAQYAALREHSLERGAGDIFHVSCHRAKLAIAEVCRYAMVRVKYDPFAGVCRRRNDPYLTEYSHVRTKGDADDAKFRALLVPMR